MSFLNEEIVCIQSRKMQMACIPFPPSCPSSYPLHGEVSTKLGPRGGETWGGCASWLQSDWSEKFRTHREGEQRRQESFAERESNDDKRVSRDKERERQGPEKFCAKKRKKTTEKFSVRERERTKTTEMFRAREREREQTTDEFRAIERERENRQQKSFAR